MSGIKRFFRPTDVAVWQQLETEMGARFQESDSWHRNKVEVTLDRWTVTLDTYFSAATKHEYTRLRTSLEDPGGLQFSIYRTGFFTDLAVRLGTQDIAIGDPQFDRDFIVKGSDESKVRELFKGQRIRDLISAQPEVCFGLNAEGVLYFEVPVVIQDLPRLKHLFELFAETLDVLCRLATDKDGK